ncbi:MAG: N-acetyl-gamma-glutamyl-phosphate reductase [Eubacteriaceae bacterium]|nr:N-acetyl-gamma-glutamyl-phosphate reductase [Eubacteriaceae bacterium]
MAGGYKIFIDGSQGTTGLNIRERLAGHEEITILEISEEDRKVSAKRAELLNECDVAFLCLPDDAAVEAVGLVTDPSTRIIDASTAHRTLSPFVYGFAELSKENRKAICSADRVAVPGCYATGFLALAIPLLEAGIITPSFPLSCFGISGYSGGGKSMIADYESEGRDIGHSSPRMYSIAQGHKHLKEMQGIAGLDSPPLFNPIVADYYSGMIVSIPLYTSMLSKPVDGQGITKIYKDKFAGEQLINVLDFTDEAIYYASNGLQGLDNMEILVCGNKDRITLNARFDNLGKGASGAAIQCLNLMLGFEEVKGLKV